MTIETSQQEEALAQQSAKAASKAYAAQSRQAVEEKLILDHLPLVRHVLQKVMAHLPRRAEQDDLLSAGTLGLVKAARNFDPTRDVEFKTYAYIRIRGEILDELRSKAVVSPAVHNSIRKVKDAWWRFQADHGYAPGNEELAAKLGMTEKELCKIFEEARTQRFLSIHGLTEDGPALEGILPADKTPSPGAQLEQSELAGQLAKAIESLPEKERLVVLLYYERDLTMREAAEVLSLTESRVSQLHASALFKLTMQMRAKA